MSKEKVVKKIDEVGHQIDNWVDGTAEKHAFPKWKVWVGIGIAALAVVGGAKLLGWV